MIPPTYNQALSMVSSIVEGLHYDWPLDD
jgi:hypothetical protein